MNIKIYDNNGKTCDRYTVVFLDEKEKAKNTYTCIAMSETPFHPQGFCQYSTAMLGRHLGKKIEFKDLPSDCQKVVNGHYEDYMWSKLKV